MSWSVSALGTPEEAQKQLTEQFKFPLAEGAAGITDPREKQTVKLVSELCSQVLTTFGPEEKVGITACGHMGFSNYEAGTGCYQSVTVSISPTF